MDKLKPQAYIYGSIVVLISAFLLFHNLKVTPPALNYDEAVNGVDALRSLATHHYQAFYAANDGREGLLIWLNSLSISLFGTDPWVLRIVSASGGLLTAIATYLLSGEVIDRMELRLSPLYAAGSALIMASSVWYLALSRIDFSGTLAASAAMFTILFMVYFERTQRWGWLLASSVIFGVGSYTYSPFRYMAIVLLPLIISAYMQSKDKIQLTVLLVVPPTILSLPLVFYAVMNPGDLSARARSLTIQGDFIPTVINHVGIWLKMLFISGDPDWLHGIPGHATLGLALFVPLLTGLIYCLMMFRTPLFGSLVLLIGLGASAMILTRDDFPYLLRFLIGIPPMFVVIAVGLAVMGQALERLRPYSDALFVILVAAIAFGGTIQYFHTWARSPGITDVGHYVYAADHWTQAEQVQSELRSGPVYVISGAENQVGNGDDTLPLVFDLVLVRIGAYDKMSAEQKGVHFVDANIPAEVKSVPGGVQVIYM